MNIARWLREAIRRNIAPGCTSPLKKHAIAKLFMWEAGGVILLWSIHMLVVGLSAVETRYDYPDIFNLIAILCTAGPPCLWLLCDSGLSREDLRLIIGPRPTRRMWLFAILTAGSTLFAVKGINTLVFYLLSASTPASVEGRFTVSQLVWKGVAPYPIVLGVYVIAVAPFLEELLFRGVLLAHWSARLGLTSATLLTTFLFASYHEPPLGPLAALVAGSACAALYVRARTLVIPIACHLLYNLLSVGIPVAGWMLATENEPMATAAEYRRVLLVCWISCLALGVPWWAYLLWSMPGGRKACAPYFMNLTAKNAAAEAQQASSKSL